MVNKTETILGSPMNGIPAYEFEKMIETLEQHRVSTYAHLSKALGAYAWKQCMEDFYYYGICHEDYQDEFLECISGDWSQDERY